MRFENFWLFIEIKFIVEKQKIKNKLLAKTHTNISLSVYEGEDFDKGWALANELNIPVVDEHYYTSPRWFISHQYRYDTYKRNATQVYLYSGS